MHLAKTYVACLCIFVFYAVWGMLRCSAIVLALEHFHSHDIVYRDLKPENIILDADGKLSVVELALMLHTGYIRVTDLGLCSLIKPGERLYHHCGTRSYMGTRCLLLCCLPIVVATHLYNCGGTRLWFCL